MRQTVTGFLFPGRFLAWLFPCYSLSRESYSPTKRQLHCNNHNFEEMGGYFNVHGS